MTHKKADTRAPGKKQAALNWRRGPFNNRNFHLSRCSRHRRLRPHWLTTLAVAPRHQGSCASSVFARQQHSAINSNRYCFRNRHSSLVRISTRVTPVREFPAVVRFWFFPGVQLRKNALCDSGIIAVRTVAAHCSNKQLALPPCLFWVAHKSCKSYYANALKHRQAPGLHGRGPQGRREGHRREAGRLPVGRSQRREEPCGGCTG